MGTEIQSRTAEGFMPKNLEEAMNLAKLLCKSELIPKDFRGKPENIMVAIQWGGEVGLSPMQAMQNIAVINGRPSLWGDAMLALCQSHHEYEYHKEWIENDVAYCAVKRRGSPEHVGSFSKAQAQNAGLWGRNTWKSYPERMLQMRARGFALRDQFSDALKGVIIREEAQDIKCVNDIIEAEAMPSVETKTIGEPHMDQVTLILKYIDSSEDLDELESLLGDIQALDDKDKDKVRDEYKKRLHELTHTLPED